MDLRVSPMIKRSCCLEASHALSLIKESACEHHYCQYLNKNP